MYCPIILNTRPLLYQKQKSLTPTTPAQQGPEWAPILSWRGIPGRCGISKLRISSNIRRAIRAIWVQNRVIDKAIVCRSPHVREGAHCWRADLTPPYKRLLSSRPELCKVTTTIINVNKFATDNKAPYLINIKQRAYVVQDCVELIQHGNNF